MHWEKVPRQYDYLLAVLVIALSVFGVVMIYSSIMADSVPLHIQNANMGLWQRQRLFIISGAVLMIGFSMLDYKYITRVYLYIYALMLVLLVVVRLMGAADGAGVARSLWIPLPFIGRISMMPSEFAKIFITIFLAKFLSITRDRFNKPLWLLLVLVLIAGPVYLVFIQPSFSASTVVLSISLVILFVGGLYWRTIIVGIAFLIPAGLLVWLDLRLDEPMVLTRILGDFQWRRIESFIRPQYATLDAVRQTEGSLYAIGTGGLTGRGFMENPYIILGHNDFIFSVVASQFGFVGAIALIAVVAVIVFRCILIAKNAPSFDGRLLAAGVAGMLIIETFFHVGVATNMLPNTGMPFPFMSYGGSMIWVHMIAIGIVLNIGLPRKPKSMFDEKLEEE